MAYGWRGHTLRALCVTSLVLGCLLGSFGAWPGGGAVKAAAATTSDDWPTYLHDTSRSAASVDNGLSTATVAQLTALWSYKTGGMIASSPTVVGGVAYVGSWDGYEYALNASTGAILWKTFLGITTAATGCYPQTLGISSVATVQNGVVYVGGGDAYWYALDATSGAVLWKVYTGDNSATGGHYNWASPLIYNGFAYIGIASLGDCPLVQGQLLKVDINTHQVVNTLNFVPNGQVGGGIWTSPTLDTATNTIFVTTGTLNNTVQTYSQAIVAVDATTLTITSSWQIPQNQTVPDSDWGNSPSIFTDASGRQLVAAINKNGYIYAFSRSNLAAGPVWQRLIAVGGDCPTCGDGSVSSMAFANGLLYIAGGNTTIGGVGYAGFVRALDPATGSSVWEHGDAAPVVPALAYDNGFVIAATGSTIEALDASNGARLYSFTTGAVLFGAPSVANGTIFFGSGDGNVYALALPASPIAPPPLDANCPAGWTCQDIGNPLPAGAESVSSTSWTITAGGAGVGGASDQFRLIAQPETGAVQIAANVSSLAASSASAQVGLMLRQSAAPASPYYAVIAEPSAKLVVQYRAMFGGATTTLNTLTTATLPLYVEIQRLGDTLQVATSTDGTAYTLVPGTTQTLILPATILAGVAASSGANGTLGAATVNAVTVGAPTSVSPAPPSSPCPSAWSCADIGNPLTVGDQSLSNGVWNIQGAGADINGYGDQFHYVWQPLAANGTLSAHISAQTNTNTSAKAGLMIRLNTSAGSPYYAALFTPAGNLVIQYRSTQGLRSYTATTTNATLPAYIEVARSGSSFSTYTSPDGVTWNYLVGSSLNLNMSGTTLIGMAVASHATRTVSAATLDSVSLSTSAPPPPVACPSNWNCADIGGPTPTGNESVNAGAWSIQGSGGDIWGVSDQFHFDWQSISGDGNLSARLASQSNTSTWAKAGLMFRLSTDPGAPYYDVMLTPSNGLVVQYRASQGASAQQVAGATGSAPLFIKIARSGTTFTAYTSADGSTWTIVAGSSITLSSMTGAVLAGMAVTSHNPGVLSLATFDSIMFDTCAGGWTCADIGSPALAGSQSASAGVWTIQGAGGDIWGTSDQFHYTAQSLAADGSISAHVASQTNTDVWAKAGLMLRAGVAANAPYYAVFVTPSNGVVVQYRASTGASAQQAATITGAAPLYLQVSRSGASFTAFTSTDGATWTAIPNSTVTLTALSGMLLAGMAVTSHNTGAISAATFDTVKFSTCPAGWGCADIGNPAIAGAQTANNGTWTIQGAGGDIWGTSDQFHYVWQSLAGDGAVSAHVVTQANTSAWAKAGVMVRQTTDAGSAFYNVVVTPANGIVVQYRSGAGLTTRQAGAVAGVAPVYLRINRSGTSFSAYTSSDGVAWSLIPNSSVSLPNLSGALLAGMAVTSHNTGAVGSVTFDSFSLGACSGVWTCADIGYTSPAGGQTLSNGVWTIQGAGGDIWGTSDQFHYVWQTLPGDGGFTAHVTAQTNTSAWAKAGIMLRLSSDPGAPFYDVVVTPSNGIVVQYRASAGSSALGLSAITGATPAYLRVMRSGTTYTAYTSADGVTWTAIPGSTITLANLSGSVLAGVAVTAHNGGAISTVTCDSVSSN